MDMPVNQFKRALREMRPQIGIYSALCSNLSIEVLAGAGFDWIFIDTEHSPNELPMVLSQLQAIAPYGTSAVVRPPANDPVLIKRYLDIGSTTLLIPYVQNAAEAEAAVRAVRYPPHGERGVSISSRANRFGRVPDYFERVHDELCLVVQLETREALNNLEAIAAVDGVDGIFVGLADLSADLGRLGQLGHPDDRRIIDDAMARIRKAGKAPGTIAAETDAQRYLDMGCVFIGVGSDIGMLARGTDALVKKFKKA